MATWIEKWIAICPDGIVTDQVINEVLALQIEQGRVKEVPIPVCEPGPTGEPGTGGPSAGDEGNPGTEIPPGA